MMVVFVELRLIKYISCFIFRLVVNITGVFRHQFFSEENVATTTVYGNDVALLKLAT